MAKVYRCRWKYYFEKRIENDLKENGFEIAPYIMRKHDLLQRNFASPDSLGLQIKFDFSCYCGFGAEHV